MFRSYIWKGVPVIAGLLTMLGRAAHADLAAPPLGKLIDDSTAIVIGAVDRVVDGPLPGTRLAVVRVEQALHGTPASDVNVLVDPTDAEAVQFEAGMRVLGFVKSPERPTSYDTMSSGGDFLPLDRDMEPATAALLRAAVGQRPQLALDSMLPFLRADSPPVPPALLMQTLTELSQHAARSDENFIIEMACDNVGIFLPQARVWAVGKVGVLMLSGGARCLQQLITDATPTLEEMERGEQELSIAAFEALGDFGAPILARNVEEFLRQTLMIHSRGIERADITPLLLDPALLAAGKIGSPTSAQVVYRAARRWPSLAVGSTAVHALGLIKSPLAVRYLHALKRNHPEELVRMQAAETLQQIGR